MATNAGGMRAIKYGVTRHQVLALEAVLATGEVIRTGGKFVKSSTGYDLTQLIVGSEGTLALVTEATLKLHPRAAHAATVLVPFATLEQVTRAVPRIVASGAGPLILEYIDVLTMAAITANVGLDLGIPKEVQEAAAAYLVVVLENVDAGPAGRGHRRRWASCWSSWGPWRSTCCPPQAAGQLISAREKAFFVAKAAGADDIIDVVVPRAAIPAFLATAGRGGRRPRDPGDRLRSRGGRERPPLGLPTRPRTPDRGPAGHLPGRDGSRWGHLGRARDRDGEEEVLPGARGPGQGGAHAADQRGLRPARDPRTRRTLRPMNRPGRPMNGAQRLIRTLVDCGVDVCFMNPGTSEMHFVAALDDVPEMRAVLGLFEGVVTGAADGYGRMAGRPAATLLHLGPGLGQRDRQPPQRPAGPDPARERGRRPRHLPPALRPAADLRHREPGPAGLVVVPVVVVRRGRGRRHGRRRGRRLRAARGVATLGGAGRRVVDRGRRRGPPSRAGVDGPRCRPGGPASVGGDVVEEAAKALRSGEPAVVLLGGGATRRAGLMAASRVAAATGAELLCETFPAALERGAGLPAVERLGYLAEFTQAQLQGARHLVLVDAVAPVSFFAYPEIPGYLVPDGCEVHVLAGAGRGRARGAGGVGRRPRGSRPTAPCSSRPFRPDRPTGALTAESAGAAIGALAARGGHRVRRGQHLGDLRPRGHGRRHRSTTGCVSPAGPSARGCRWPPGRRWPARTGRCCPWRPTGVRCTRCSRCGPRPARVST